MKKSLIRKTIVQLIVQMALLICMLIVYAFVSYWSTVENMQQSAENFIRLYGAELDNKLKGADRILEQLAYNSTEYTMLQSTNESERYYASIHLSQLLQKMVSSNSFVDFIVITEADYQTCLTAENILLKEQERKAALQFALDCAAEGRMKAKWSIRMMEEKAYVYKMYVWQDRTTGVFMSVDRFMEAAATNDFDSMVLLLADTERNIWGAYGRESIEWAAGEKLEEKVHEHMLESENMIADGQFRIYSYTNLNEFSGQIAGSSLIILCIIVISLFSGFFLVQGIRRDILMPMRDMRENMRQIEDGDYGHRITCNYRSLEFELLKKSFNKLMDEIVSLKIRSYEKQIELQESELRSIRLQIRPHFFLNAMAAISSLSMQGKDEEIKKYIEALSKNIRYMFKSGLHTVPLCEEVRHVKNYFEMQELKYPESVFYYISMEPGTEEWAIPQMIIHTVIENEYKYAVSVDNVLSILIKTYQTQRNGEKMLCIEIEDDGKGYPTEVLDQFDMEDARPFPDGSRVGLWSIRKMLEIMYEKKDLFAISNIKPHGCLNRFYIPEKPVCEAGMETIQNTIE